MALSFVPAIFHMPRRTRFLAPAVSGRRSPHLSERRGWASVRCCVESPDWKKGPVDVDFAKDEQLQILEDDLDKALSTEDFARASQVRDKLLRLQSGTYVSVLSANLKFYNAFGSGSIVDMAGVWLQDAGATCKHPLGPLCVGYTNIINSFGYLFSFGVPNIHATNVVITMRGSCAWVTCDEHCDVVEETAKENASGNKFKESQIREIVMSATNIFVKHNGQWYLAHHTAQPVYKEESKHFL